MGQVILVPAQPLLVITQIQSWWIVYPLGFIDKHNAVIDLLIS